MQIQATRWIQRIRKERGIGQLQSGINGLEIMEERPFWAQDVYQSSTGTHRASSPSAYRLGSKASPRAFLVDLTGLPQESRLFTSIDRFVGGCSHSQNQGKVDPRLVSEEISHEKFPTSHSLSLLLLYAVMQSHD